MRADIEGSPAEDRVLLRLLNVDNGLAVRRLGGQQLGTVTRVDTLPDGKVKDVELQSGGFLGMFKTTYVVPADKVAKKGSRIELSMTSDQAKQFAK